MIPVGYMARRIHERPDWLKAPNVVDIYSVACCSSEECSPLSCNHLAEELRTNSHCLLDSFEEAKASLDSGKFEDTEPGPYRIFAVFSVDWPEIAAQQKSRKNLG